MSDLWLKIKAWTKGILAGIVLLYLILFFSKNSGQTVTFWFWFKHEPVESVLLIEFACFFAGVIATLIAITSLRTVKQIQAVRTARRTDRLEREVADMKMKSSMLQTRQEAPASAAPPAAAPAGVTVQVDKLGGAGV
jgi:hypothetical protein